MAIASKNNRNSDDNGAGNGRPPDETNRASGAWQNIAWTVAILAGFGLFGSALWLFETWMSAT